MSFYFVLVLEGCRSIFRDDEGFFGRWERRWVGWEGFKNIEERLGVLIWGVSWGLEFIFFGFWCFEMSRGGELRLCFR